MCVCVANRSTAGSDGVDRFPPSAKAFASKPVAPHPPRVKFLATLSKYTALVNVARFTPGAFIASAGDRERCPKAEEREARKSRKHFLMVIVIMHNSEGRLSHAPRGERGRESQVDRPLITDVTNGENMLGFGRASSSEQSMQAT